jgi:DNA-binding NarL/FixJ family response regulator
LQIYSELKPDIVVMDLSMAGIGGLETTRRLVMREDDAKIIVFSVHHEKVYIQRALDAGARGYICKHAHPDMLIDAIKQVAKGRIYIDPSLVDDAQHQEDMTTYQTIIATLSPREFDVFVLLAKGMTAHQISDELCLSYKTVANYGTTIRSKLNVTSMAQLANIAALLDLT